jgi:hypothetical protein
MVNAMAPNILNPQQPRIDRSPFHMKDIGYGIDNSDQRPDAESRPARQANAQN